MATGMQVWSQTAATNASIDSNANWAEGMAPSQVDDSARAMMASAAKWRDDNNSTITTSGSTTAYTANSSQVSTGLIAGYTIAVIFHATNDSSATLNVDGNGALPMQTVLGTNLIGGEFQTGSMQRFTCSSGSSAWVANHVIAAAPLLAVNSVGYSKIQNESDSTLLANAQGNPWPPQEIVIGKGLILSTTSTSTSQSSFTSTTTSTAIPFTLTAPAFPPPAAFKNLSIKVTGTSSATATADFATLATSGSSQFQTVALSGNINFGANGSVNQLDAGSLASGAWYALYGIANAAGSLQGWLASTSFTTPLLPSGYTYKARLGAVVTSTSTASAQLMGTYQFGRRAQYVLGVGASGSALPTLGSGSVGTVQANPVYITVSTTKYIPQTATQIKLIPAALQSGGQIVVAPSTSYNESSPMPVQLFNTGGNPNTYPLDLVLETSNIYWASNGAANILVCMGWEDNL